MTRGKVEAALGTGGPRVIPPLYHFTCDHGRASIGGKGWINAVGTMIRQRIPADAPRSFELVASLVWLTEDPTGAGAGLELYEDSIIACDRLAHRYRAIRPNAVRWSSFAAPPEIRRELETSRPGLNPDSWWVATAPVLAVYDPPV